MSSGYAKPSWIFFPPIASLPLGILAAIAGSSLNSQSIPGLLWGSAISAYICMCAISLYSIFSGHTKYQKSVFLLSQGIICSWSGLQFGSGMFGWLGLLLFLFGLILAFYHVTYGGNILYPRSQIGDDDDGAAEGREKIDGLIKKLPLPFCVTDSRGIVVSANSAFLKATGKDDKNVLGNSVDELLPLDTDEVTLSSGHWWIEQVKEGTRHFFTLLPTQGGVPAKGATAQSQQALSPAHITFIDPETGLYTDEYRMIRGPEEVSRSQRYRRWLSGLLLDLTFEPMRDVKITDQQKKMMFNALAVKVKEALRSMDCGFLIKDKLQIQVLLPETPQAGAKTLLGRMLTIPQDIFDEDIREHIHPTLRSSLFFFNGTPPMEYSIFSAALEEDMVNASRDDNPMAVGE